MELENLMAKQEAEQQLRYQQARIENEREEIKLCRWQEELRLQQPKRGLENEIKKAEAHEE